MTDREPRGRGRKSRTEEEWQAMAREYDEEPKLSISTLAKRHRVNMAELQMVLQVYSERAKARRYR